MFDWTEERKARFAALFRLGVQRPALMAEFGITANAVAGLAHRLGLTMKERPGGFSPWKGRTYPKKRKLKPRVEFSFEAIKEAVENLPPIPIKAPIPRVRLKEPEPETSVIPIVSIVPEQKPSIIVLQEEDFRSTTLSAAGRSVLQLRLNQCRYPFGDPKLSDFYFCSAIKERGSAFCEDHKKLCWRPPLYAGGPPRSS